MRNGLRVISEHMPSVRSVSLGIWIDTGSRYEGPFDNGVSHFIEHMLFKGTRRRTARQIAASLESLGGNLNAFTSREHTCYTARILDENLATAIDVLADMTCHATFTPLNLRREKKVICEEIREVEGNPAERIHDIFSDAFWGNHPLGRPIVGTPRTVTDFKRHRVLDFMSRHYRSGTIVIAAAGCVSHQKLLRLVRDNFDFPTGRAEPAENACREKEQCLTLKAADNPQTHLCLGYPGLDFTNEYRIPAVALNSYLGSGMSSVLFQKVREQRGLAYSIYSFHDFYSDAGVCGAYMATDRNQIRQALDIVLGEFEKVKKRRLPQSRLDKIKSQLKGQLAIGLESTTGRMNRLARLELMGLPFRSHQQILREVNAVTSGQILNLANRLFDRSRLAIAVLGPVADGDLDGVL
ncbi:MAG: pitrilysin family protein [bacterium]